MKPEQLKKLRVEVLGLSQQQFADIHGIPRVRLSRYENGVTLIPQEFIDRLKRYPQLPYVTGEETVEHEDDITAKMCTKFYKPLKNLSSLNHELGKEQLVISKINKPEIKALAGQLDQAMSLVKVVISKLDEMDKEILSYIEEG